ncbi:selenocysteine-specific translation elongation factor [Limnochorda pilosa]|uniref:Selenocysteine-specific elongation factor n=1 Tax=Limnochorda pilosa TaxID=1555112 RepID=A0A0K2SR86_LIMPI|nr:selenocysteine-specific translation elongation factor [Limnochorda pilosa]BAS29339.1 translation elongation factor [Limnochorda pilosa]
MHVIGTAGHIDHGKSTLIRALTGIDPDRLAEEKARGMTIDLGFAWIRMPSGEEAGIVDVPGHHRFVRNMLAGVGGIDVTLFVVAATDGWMPQSEEHLAILDLLGVSRGVVALTMADRVEPDWLELVRDDVAQRIARSSLAGAPIIPVSAVTGQGLEELVAELDRQLRAAPPVPDEDRARLWVDRVFTIRGAGTVVTGTLEGGTLGVDQRVEVLPGSKVARVRGLETHKQARDQAVPGSRVAVNLSGVGPEEVARGQAIAAPGRYRVSDRFNAWIRLLESTGSPLQDLAQVLLYLGSAERNARVRILEGAVLEPGQAGLVQVEVEGSLPVQWSDRFILRDPGVQATLGGGRVLEPFARRVRGRRLRLGPVHASWRGARRGGSGAPEYLDPAWLRSLADSPVGALVGRFLAAYHVIRRSELPVLVPLGDERLAPILDALDPKGEAVVLPGYVASRAYWEWAEGEIGARLESFHRAHPLRNGCPAETLRSGLGMEEDLFQQILDRMVARGKVVRQGPHVRLSTHQVQLGPEQERARAALLARLDGDPFEPPTFDELVDQGADPELVAALIEQGELVRTAKGLVLSSARQTWLMQLVERYITEHGAMEVRELRDVIDTSRKYAVPLMEHLDEVGFTRRLGDRRVLARGGPTGVAR